LIPAIEKLEKTAADPVAGRELEWGTQVALALDELSVALRRHKTDCEERGGMFSEVDLERPTLSRQVANLRQAHDDLLTRIADLKAGAQQAAQTFAHTRQAPPTGDLPPPSGDVHLVDFDALRQAVRDLAEALRSHWKQETDLIQESVTTDLGAGD
jgi:hypothetical protein